MLPFVCLTTVLFGLANTKDVFKIGWPSIHSRLNISLVRNPHSPKMLILDYFFCSLVWITICSRFWLSKKFRKVNDKDKTNKVLQKSPKIKNDPLLQGAEGWGSVRHHQLGSVLRYRSEADQVQSTWVPGTTQISSGLCRLKSGFWILMSSVLPPWWLTKKNLCKGKHANFSLPIMY